MHHALATHKLLSPLTLLFLLCVAVPCAAQQDAHSWCGNTIFDPTKPKGLTDWARAQIRLSKAAKRPVVKAPPVSESEPNNSLQQATFLDVSSGVGTMTETRQLPITPPPPAAGFASENNDRIGSASPLNIPRNGADGLRISGQAIGDGQFGPTSGDFDFYSFSAVRGDLLLVDVTASLTLDPFAAIYNASGQLLFVNDDEVRGSRFDPYFTWTPETDGTYYLMIGGYGTGPFSQQLPTNPFVAGTGQGAGSVGDYSVTVHRLLPLLLAFEENATIPTATILGDLRSGAIEFFVSGFIGDSLNPIPSGDYDFFAFQVNAGQSVEFSVRTPDPFASGSLDPVLGIFDGFGNLIAGAGDDDIETGVKDATLTFNAQTAGVYYACVGAQISPIPQLNFPDPFTGIGSGNASMGFYVLLVGTNNRDPDWLSFNALRGEVITARLLGGADAFGLTAPSGLTLGYTRLNVNSFSAPDSGFPVGEISLAVVAPETGTYGMELVSTGILKPSEPWQVDVVIEEPGLREKPVGARQIVFVDFDGATLNASVVTGPNEMRTLSPLSSFLASWGIPGNQESELITKTLAVMSENLKADLAAVGGNGNFDTTGIPGEFGITLLNSRDHADPFGQPDVSRIIIGGTVAQLGVQTIGIAQSIDPGNTNTEETAVVLLDLLSSAADQQDSLNQYAIAPGSSRVDVVARGVGNIASHEIGHYVGNWHTVNSNSQKNIMDQGGVLDNTMGVGQDNVFGTPDDIDVDFATDAYEPGEVYFLGFENTIRAMAFGLSTGTVEQPAAPTNVWMFE